MFRFLCNLIAIAVLIFVQVPVNASPVELSLRRKDVLSKIDCSPKPFWTTNDRIDLEILTPKLKEMTGTCCNLTANEYVPARGIHMCSFDEVYKVGKQKTEVKLQMMHYIYGGNTTLYIKNETCIAQTIPLLSGCSEGKYFKGGCTTGNDGIMVCMWPSNSTRLEKLLSDDVVISIKDM